ncbi:hypothetical protein PHAVU_004G078100 [Phaseolus vulgaris]|uniref:Uncharacterized protein n=1 Tax=Phaseolus vulgaris TaxID=3885 RepID=V7C0X2_PHAVU|nr:hypothetical protein PHAVU_004G078100g [Phaseolus vulgaris]ESW23817.1 hypothetical protein PHAVU_004G078100g [Phaseolus vulgaris]
MTLNERLLRGNLVHILVMLFCYLCFDFTFQKSCFLAGILAQASPISLRRVEQRKVGCSLESSRSTEINRAQASLTMQNLLFLHGISLKQDNFRSNEFYNEKK